VEADQFQFQISSSHQQSAYDKGSNLLNWE